MTNEVVKRYPWEPVPVQETVAALQRDVAYMVTHTAVQVRSSRNVLEMVFNTPRGQVIPRGVCSFTDGTTVEFCDIGMPQVGAPMMTVHDIVSLVSSVAKDLGLEMQQ